MIATPQQLIEMQANEPPDQRSMSILFSSDSNKWFTPSVYAEAARKVMGEIELDPASCDKANQSIRAIRYYTEEANGLLQDWSCSSMWLNPPYGTTTNGKSNQGIWARRLLSEHRSGHVKQAVLLVNAKTDTRWFEPLWDYPICFTSGRVNFYTPDLSTTIGNTNGSCFVYLGPNEQKFINEFSAFGTIAKRVSTPRVKPTPLSLWEEK